MMHIFERLKAGEIVRLNEPQFEEINQIVGKTLALMPLLNSAKDINEVRKILSEITGTVIDPSTAIFAPLYINFGRFTTIGKNVFINHACSFLDLGGITIEDDVLIGPKVNLITENHPLEPSERRNLTCKPILIKRNAWIGAAATILPGVTIGKNSVVAAGAVVSRDVPDDTIVGGIPAKIIKQIA
ncbi:sugar O-acetyltransferase [Mucilaginibacter achroorhodeus]|uniref:Sugar O-acetyltransferase n=1 Tax=Mucilaginibacter achroorhodeus TaxID=2599294 RepID=A0A563U292_9SPHI|nr:DapH/DapD/GlmU-related protein [Mucilaginibacter achroorhodeus]TWR24889.1 sugar O-acetyltransferase [Mucilaginibacter achroorhodeus]